MSFCITPSQSSTELLEFYQILLALWQKIYKIHWPFCKLDCSFVIIWWPDSENHWPWAPSHYILEVWKEGRKCFFKTHSTHFIYGYMMSDIWLRTILIVRKETRCGHIGYSFRLTARVFYMHNPTDRIAHTTAFVTPVVEH